MGLAVNGFGNGFDSGDLAEWLGEMGSFRQEGVWGGEVPATERTAHIRGAWGLSFTVWPLVGNARGFCPTFFGNEGVRLACGEATLGSTGATLRADLRCSLEGLGDEAGV